MSRTHHAACRRDPRACARTAALPPAWQPTLIAACVMAAAWSLLTPAHAGQTHATATSAPPSNAAAAMAPPHAAATTAPPPKAIAEADPLLTLQRRLADKLGGQRADEHGATSPVVRVVSRHRGRAATPTTVTAASTTGAQRRVAGAAAGRAGAVSAAPDRPPCPGTAPSRPSD
jgi:hypothetical protein